MNAMVYNINVVMTQVEVIRFSPGNAQFARSTQSRRFLMHVYGG